MAPTPKVPDRRGALRGRAVPLTAPPPAARAPEPVVPEKATCPFTGRDLDIREVRGAQGEPCYMGIGQFYTTKIFQTRRQLLYWLHFRDGQAPAFSSTSNITVSTVEPPAPNPIADQIEKDRQVEEKALDDLSRNPILGGDRKIISTPGGNSSAGNVGSTVR